MVRRNGRFACTLTVIPTRVGMVRRDQLARLSDSYPHARGDGPLCTMAYVTTNITGGKASYPHARGDGPSNTKTIRAVNATQLSPRAWGWSALTDGTRSGYGVIPTRVGMVRRLRSASQGVRYPHARGDGPTIVFSSSRFSVLSPRAWGWSAIGNPGGGICGVIPTRVGMVRMLRSLRDIEVRYPHARGDGPYPG